MLITNAKLLCELILDLNNDAYLLGLVNGHIAEGDVFEVISESLNLMSVIATHPDHYEVIFFGGKQKLSQAELETHFSQYPTNKPIRNDVSINCAYLLKFPSEAETVLNALTSVFINQTVVKTLEDEDVKGRIS